VSTGVEPTITLTEEGDWWVAKDTETGVLSQGKTKTAALSNLEEALAGIPANEQRERAGRRGGNESSDARRVDSPGITARVKNPRGPNFERRESIPRRTSPGNRSRTFSNRIHHDESPPIRLRRRSEGTGQ
jgi:predicted RNase H-like HicB family nuclease